MDKCNFIKFFYAWRETIKKMKRNPQNGRGYLQNIHLIKNLYAEYIKNSYSLTVKRPIIQLSKEQEIKIDISPKKTYKWPVSAWKDAQHHVSLRHAQLLSHVRFFETPWTVAHQVPLSMKFFRQECLSGLPFPPPGCLPYPGIKPCLLHLLHWQVYSLPLVPPGKPC